MMVKNCAFSQSSEPGLFLARVELSSCTGESVIADGWLVRSKQGHIRLEMPTSLLSDEGTLIVRNIPTIMRKFIETAVLHEFQSWLPGAR